jgi:16S rRNA (adenine1518-N6/adenine1519-N6)-dimethyltransferase
MPDWENAAVALGLNPKARAEELSLGQWIALANYIAPITSIERVAGPEESFSVVDERDQLVGAAPRSKVHANNLLHRAVHLLIFNPAGEVFLQLRSRGKDRHPLAWDSSAAGHVNAGEEYDQSATRELREELGINTSLVRIAKLPASERTGYEFIWLYRGLYDGELRLDPAEIEAGRFFAPVTVDAWIKARPREFAPGFIECWKIWREKNP